MAACEQQLDGGLKGGDPACPEAAGMVFDLLVVWCVPQWLLPRWSQWAWGDEPGLQMGLLVASCAYLRKLFLSSVV